MHADRFDGWLAASGLGLSPRKCALVPLWAYDADDVSARVVAVCPQLEGCAVSGSARYLGVEVEPAAHESQWVVVRLASLARVGRPTL